MAMLRYWQNPHWFLGLWGKGYHSGECQVESCETILPFPAKIVNQKQYHMKGYGRNQCYPEIPEVGRNGGPHHRPIPLISMSPTNTKCILEDNWVTINSTKQQLPNCSSEPDMVSVLDHIKMALDTKYMAINPINVFFSVLIRRDDQSSSHSRGTGQVHIHSVAFELC